MTAGTKIEWADDTFNPWWGCARVSPGCNHCYAETFAKRVGQDVWGKGGNRRLFGDKHWREPEKWNRDAEREGVRRRVFCASMADVFEDHPALPSQRDRLWDLIARTPYLDWLLLTKRPENITGMLPAVSWPNVWLGTTVEDQERAESRIPELLAVPHDVAVRFLSCEPLLSGVTVSPWLIGRPYWGEPYREPTSPTGVIVSDLNASPSVGWVICGGESGPKSRPMRPEWARSLRDECVAAGVPFHFKQWGQHDETGRRVTSKHDAGRILDGRTHDDMPAVGL